MYKFPFKIRVKSINNHLKLDRHFTEHSVLQGLMLPVTKEREHIKLFMDSKSFTRKLRVKGGKKRSKSFIQSSEGKRTEEDSKIK
jgi:hypothetical protein